MSEKNTFKSEEELIQYINTYDRSSNATNSIIIKDVFIQCSVDIGMWFADPKKMKLNSDIADFLDNKKRIKISIVFIDVHFLEEVHIYGLSFLENINFYNCMFVKYVQFTSNIFNQLMFNSCKFMFLLTLNQNIFEKNISLHECVYNKLEFDNNTCEKKCGIFLGKELNNVNFSKTKFEGIADFKEVALTNCDFSFTRFMGEADFKRAKFYGKSTFRYTQFNDRGAFHGAFFEQDPIFYNLILGTNSHVYFGNLNRINIERGENETDKEFNKRVQKRLEELKIAITNIENKTEKEFDKYVEQEELNIVIKKITIENTIINGRLDFNNDNITTLDMKGSVVVGTLARVLFTSKSENWETACILKNEELKRNNFVESLKFQAEEKKLYTDELKKDLRYIKFIFLTYKKNIILDAYKNQTIDNKYFYNILDDVDIELYELRDIPKEIQSQKIMEWCSLWLGKTVNNHGQDWGKAILFTLWVWVFCFVLSFLFPMIWIKYDDEINLWIEFFRYFIPLNIDGLICLFTQKLDIGLKIWSSFWYMLGKIFIPYGVYEVIKAFRKYR